MEKNKMRPENITGVRAKSFNPLNLAFMGDAIYENYIRRYLVLNHPDFKVNELHRYCISFVKATSQAKIALALMDSFTDEEKYIYKRGRNAQSATVPKNTPVTDYKRATGFEAVLGYLFLTGQIERLEEIIEAAILYVEELY